MQDMLVRLTDLPHTRELEESLAKQGVVFRRPIAPEKRILVEWTKANFSDYWASEMDVAFSHHPVTCFIAQSEGQPVGFSCYETTAKNFFGPTGVIPAYRGTGIGKVLLIKALMSLRALGYAYAVIGGVGPAAYYQKVVGAVIIEGSGRSVYQDLLRKDG